MKTSHQLLIAATQKLIELNDFPDWKNQLMRKAPPILWFGDSNASKSRILTVGANPSRWEFLQRKKGLDLSEGKDTYEKAYLERPRFRVLNDQETYSEILSNETLRESIINSFNRYFSDSANPSKPNPYNWFGSEKHYSYRVEGVLQGMGASYFNSSADYTAIHVDLFPFATIEDFVKIKSVAERDIFSDSWAIDMLKSLITLLRAQRMLVFGRTNYNYFLGYTGIESLYTEQFFAVKGRGKCTIWVASYCGLPVLAVSTNLGNPKGFDSMGLWELGQRLNQLSV